MNKSNLEIIVEELKEFVANYWSEDNLSKIVNKNNICWFAQILLKKLNIEEGEVIAEGRVRYNRVGGMTLNDDEEDYIFASRIIEEKAFKYKGKKIQIIIREVK